MALGDVSLDIAAGEFLVLVGSSGCGKSTLLNLIAGLLDVTSGTIDRAAELSRPGSIGMVFQSPVLLPWRNVLSNVLVATEILRLDRTEYMSKARQLLELVGLQDFERALPYQLSGGMQQRASICRALLTDPGLLLMDEPFGALDAITREQMNLELLRIWTQSRSTVVLVTHSIQEAVFLSDRIVVMTPRPGRVASVIENRLARPRDLSTYQDPLFSDYAARIRETILSGKVAVPV
jgi:NitT/TauT family transport system ATP-binding protein